MLKAPRSCQLKAWQKGVAFKTSFSFDRNCTVFPEYLLQFAQERKESVRTEMSPKATQSKAWVWCLFDPARGRKRQTFSFLAIFVSLSGRTEFCWTLTYVSQFSMWHSGLRVQLEPSEPHGVLVDRPSPLEAPGELLEAEVPQKPGETFLSPSRSSLHPASLYVSIDKMYEHDFRAKLYLKIIPVNNSFFRIPLIPNT